MPDKRLSNIRVMDSLRDDLGLSYQERVPRASQAGLEATANAIFNYDAIANAFIEQLVNRIGSVIGQAQSFNNPLAPFKTGTQEYGDSIEEYHINMLRAKSYSADRDYLERDIFGQEVPDVQSIFHRVNRQDFYKFTINHDILKRAMLTANGLDEFLNKVMAAPVSSDNFDEFLLMCRLFRSYEDHQGYYKVQIPDLTDPNATADDSRKVLKLLRSYLVKLTFPSRLYNASSRDVFARPDELVILTDPDVQASIDVDALSAAFNEVYANSNIDYVQVPKEYFGLEDQGASMILTTREFFRVFDVLQKNTTADNPVGLYKNFFFHHHQIISNSLFVPAILFTTSEATNPEKITVYSPTTLTIALDPDVYDNDEPLIPGHDYDLKATFEPEITDGQAEPAVVYKVTSATTSRRRASTAVPTDTPARASTAPVSVPISARRRIPPACCT